jgi:hypothetical protein
MTDLFWGAAALIAFFIRSEKHHPAIVHYAHTHSAWTRVLHLPQEIGSR